MKNTNEIQNLIEELNIHPIELHNQDDLDNPENISDYLTKLKSLLSLISSLPENEIGLYDDIINENCENVTAIMEKMILKQKKIRNDILAIEGKLQMQHENN